MAWRCTTMKSQLSYHLRNTIIIFRTEASGLRPFDQREDYCYLLRIYVLFVLIRLCSDLSHFTSTLPVLDIHQGVLRVRMWLFFKFYYRIGQNLVYLVLNSYRSSTITRNDYMCVFCSNKGRQTTLYMSFSRMDITFNLIQNWAIPCKSYTYAFSMINSYLGPYWTTPCSEYSDLLLKTVRQYLILLYPFSYHHPKDAHW